MKDCPYIRVRENGKDKVLPKVPSEEAPRRQQFFVLKYKGVGEKTSVDVSDA